MSEAEVILEHATPELSAAWTVIRSIGWALGLPFWYIGVAVLFVLKLVWWPLAFLLQPLFYLGQFIGACLLFPVRLLIHYETIYIYLGVAALVGLSLGLIGRAIFHGLRTLLALDMPILESASGGRTLREYRAAKRQAREAQEDQLQAPQHMAPQQQHQLYMNMLPARVVPGAPGSPGYVSASTGHSAMDGGSGKVNGKVKRAVAAAAPSVPQRGLYEQTIMEEDDSDF